jgi:hypothetical protein
MTEARHRRAWLVGTACVVLAAMASTAHAGTYTVWSCRDGANASTEGLPDWSHSSFGVGYISTVGPACYTAQSSGTDQPFGAVVYGSPTNNANLVTDDMSLSAPPGVSLQSARLWWRGEAGATGQVAAIAAEPDGTQRVLIDHRNVAFPPVGDPSAGGPPTETVSLGGATGLVLRAACLSACQNGDVLTTIADYSAYRVALSVLDTTPPAGQATGDLLIDSVLNGQRSVAVTAADRGGGTYLARVVVDGQVAAGSTLGDGPCRDVDPANSDPFEFTTVLPCPERASTMVALDTNRLGEDLRHDIRVEILDAAGNSTVVAERSVGVDNQPPADGYFDRRTRRFQNPLFDIAAPRRLNGEGASSNARLRVYLPKGRRAAAARTVAFRSRPTLRARLTDASGRPITGAALWMATRDRGEDWRISGPPHMTSKTGRIGLRLPAGHPSRMVNLVYFPFSDSHKQTVGRPVRLGVRAGVRLSVSRSRIRNGQRLTFTGRVAGLRAGRGVLASLQAKVRGSYRSFRQVRVLPAAEWGFRTTYRFTRTGRATRYRFRLAVLKQAGMPYEAGFSPVRTVIVTP